MKGSGKRYIKHHQSVSCVTKTKYATRKDAEKYAQTLKHNPFFSFNRLRVYYCHACKGFHLTRDFVKKGRKNKGGKPKEES